ncbi:MAG TPA: VWA domain-containing protein [Vicinamibacterales bacterium]|nr:VWA domain-containing protein [Vicinamibacterales bacterium]
MKVAAAILTLSLASTSLVSRSAAQSQAAPQDSAVFRSGASLVALNVTVTDSKERFVTGLEVQDFAVFEDGIQQDVRFFESSAIPIDLIILLDTSASMRHRLETVQRAALGFVDTLREGDRAAVVAFNDGVDVLQGLTSGRGLLESAIRSTTARGATALHNALYVALKQFGRSVRDTSEVRRQALAVLSDGDDTSSLISFEDVLEIARKSGVSVYTISLVSDYSERAFGAVARAFSDSDYGMRKLAQDTGALSFFPRSADELGGIYDSIAKELSNQYSIGYAPRNARADGRYRRITVRVPSRPELRSRARSGYLAPGQPPASGQSPHER